MYGFSTRLKVPFETAVAKVTEGLKKEGFGVLYPTFGLLLSPIIAALVMSLSSVSVIVNALRLRTLKF